MLSKRISAAIVSAGLFAIPALVLGQTQSEPARSGAADQARSGRPGADERTAEKRPDPKRYDRQVQAFLDADKSDPPAACQILFVGSASISGWRTIKEDLAPNPVFARGLGASTVEDQLYYFDKIVTPYKPRAIFLYAGENDVVNGLTPDEVLGDMKKYMDYKTRALGNTPVYYISAKASPARLQYAEDQQKANELVQGLTTQRKDLTYIDVAHGVWENGKLFGKLLPVFVEDGIHLNDVGRKEWTRVIKPQVDKEAARKDACR